MCLFCVNSVLGYKLSSCCFERLESNLSHFVMMNIKVFGTIWTIWYHNIKKLRQCYVYKPRSEWRTIRPPYTKQTIYKNWAIFWKSFLCAQRLDVGTLNFFSIGWACDQVRISILLSIPLMEFGLVGLYRYLQFPSSPKKALAVIL